MFKIKRLSTSTQLLLLCWVVYTCSYIGKLGYNANINQIALAYHVSYSDAGMVSTFFFVAYGAGQVINGLLCKHYNPKYIIFVCLFLSGIINLAVPCITEFSFLKYFLRMEAGWRFVRPEPSQRSNFTICLKRQMRQKLKKSLQAIKKR